ncbi:nucleotidyltransferase domain-containing protein [Spirosoma oryzicola]|uniref:nucleotidyltransferase domain-containing protein n=1 Tax=Spirosoma oryzicola TaxID=2898794 RepID=UPI001E5D8514|nr:nucleotidyltransferase domain-containing protein [Spirosoma oryzicola]UHG92034.1 nucleotidyltransferase domain-containing protein [Spirosoma oryzicola]
METTYQPKALTPDALHALSQEVKQALTELYGDRLNRVILYGSYARGDFHAESDVDYLVVLNDPEVKAGQEVRLMSQVSGPLSLKYDVDISVFPPSLGAHFLL